LFQLGFVSCFFVIVPRVPVFGDLLSLRKWYISDSFERGEDAVCYPYRQVHAVERRKGPPGPNFAA